MKLEVHDLDQHTELEKKVEEHTVLIQELKDEIDFKRWKIDTLIEKIDNLTKVVQEIQLSQLKDDSDIKNRVTGIESTIKTLKWVTGIGLSIVGTAIAVLGFVITFLH